jgi:hypothetical protein
MSTTPEPKSTTAASSPAPAAAPAKKKLSTVVTMTTPKIIAGDIATALVVGAVVAVPISIVDFAIMAKVSGVVPTMMTQVIAGTKTLLTNPYHFFVTSASTPIKYALIYRLCVGVYAATYIIANVTRSFCEGYAGMSPEKTALATGIASSAANVYATMLKDVAILKVMPKAAGAPAAAVAEKVFVPMLSRFGFALRDTLTVLSAFTAVPLVKARILSSYPDGQVSDGQAQTAASLITPCSVQIFSTTIHIGSIKYQRMYSPTRRWAGPEGYTAAIVSAIKNDYINALNLRMLCPARPRSFSSIISRSENNHKQTQPERYSTHDAPRRRRRRVRRRRRSRQARRHRHLQR